MSTCKVVRRVAILYLLAWQAVAGAASADQDLVTAVRRGDSDVVQQLLSAGVDPHGTDHTGRPLLTLAASLGYAEVVQVLLKQGADINAVDREGRNSLMLAAAGGHMAVVDALLAGKAELDRQDTNGMTALHWAAMRARPQVIAAALVNKGAAVNITTRNWGHPLLFASARRDH